MSLLLSTQATAAESPFWTISAVVPEAGIRHRSLAKGIMEAI